MAHVNDTYGHPGGDLVLAAVARTLKATVRDGDFPARLGGEEFCAVLCNADVDEARMVAERFRVATQCTPTVLEDGQVVNVTCSVGIAMLETDDACLDAALARADAALYQAKQNGRNRVETQVEPAVTPAG